MANRYTDSTIWKKQKWFKKLPPIYKLAWKYLADECNHAGIWKIDMSELLDDLGLEDFNLDEFMLLCNKDFDKLTGKGIKRQRIIQITGDRLWLTGFITFQYGGKNQCVKHSNNIIKSALELLKTFKIYDLAVKNKYIIFEDLPSVPNTSEDLPSVPKTSEHRQRPKDKDKVKDNVLDINTDIRDTTIPKVEETEKQEPQEPSTLKQIKLQIQGLGEISVNVFTGCDIWQLRELEDMVKSGQRVFEGIAMTVPLMNKKDNFNSVLQAFINMIQQTGEYQTSSALRKHFGNWLSKKNGQLQKFIDDTNNDGIPKKKMVM